jgi:hypothetical protein
MMLKEASRIRSVSGLAEHLIEGKDDCAPNAAQRRLPLSFARPRIARKAGFGLRQAT